MLLALTQTGIAYVIMLAVVAVFIVRTIVTRIKNKNYNR